MATTTAPANSVQRELIAGKRRRRRREAVLGLLFVLPAALVTFVFGLWPVIFGFFVSLHQWRPSTHIFLGLDNYVRALGNTAYVMALLLGGLFLYGGYRALKNARADMQAGHGSVYPFVLPGAVMALGLVLLAGGLLAEAPPLALFSVGVVLAGIAVLAWTVRHQPHIAAWGRFAALSVQMSTLWLLALGLFLFTLIEFDANSRLFFDIIAYQFPNLYVPPLAQQMAAGGGAALALLGIVVAAWGRRRLQAAEQEHDRLVGLLQAIMIALGVVLVILFFYFAAAITYDHAAAQAVRGLERSDVEAAGIAVTGLERQAFRATYGSINGDRVAAALVAWPQIVLILTGLLLIYAAYRVWRQTVRSEMGMKATAFLLLTVLAAIGGWLLIGELPQALAVGDVDYYESLIVTVAYAAGTVPIQIGLGLLIAYILFYEIHLGRSLYRMIYFMPYVAPTVATATVFVIIFSRRDTSLANQVVGLLNIPPQAWLSESKGIFQLIANAIAGTRIDLPSFLVGPSLALLSVILYGTWVFSGYNAVIFLAGLGSIPAELYEAAKVDGAGRWQAFRKITLPLLSPTTFFLIILGTIGTFQAFNHIYVLRKAEAQGTADTATVHVFIQFWTYNQWGYASAMAFVLFGIILLMTLVQNEVSKERVFYG